MAKLNGGGGGPVAITDTFVCGDQTCMLGLTAQTGDVCVRTDQSKTYILQGTDPTVLSQWVLLLNPPTTITAGAGISVTGAAPAWTVASTITQGITGSGVATQISVFTGTGTVIGYADLIWDDTNKNLIAGSSQTVTGSYQLVSGQGNTVAGTHQIVGGQNHTIVATSTHNAVFGLGHLVNGSAGSNIIAGRTNYIDGTRNALFGESTSINGNYNIAAGYNHAGITGEANAVFGWQNKIIASYGAVMGRANDVAGDYNAVFGYGNKVTNGGNLVVGVTNQINGGGGNIVSGLNNIFGGNYHVVGGTDNSLLTSLVPGVAGHDIVHGANNTVVATLSAVFGQLNSVDGSWHIVAGKSNGVTGNYNAVVGDNNSVLADYNIVGGTHNSIAAGSTHNLVYGYYQVLVSGGQNYLGGEQNTVNANWSLIHGRLNTVSGNDHLVGGNTNAVATSTNPSLAGGTVVWGDHHAVTAVQSAVFGSTNTVLGSYNTISGQLNVMVHATSWNAMFGYGNSIANDHYNIVAGSTIQCAGQGNAMFGGNHTTNYAVGNYNLVAGQSHQINASSNCLVTGYQNIAWAPYSTVTGLNARAINYGQEARATGMFSAIGDAQTSQLVARKITTNDTPTEIALDGATNYLSTKDNTAYAFVATIIAKKVGASDHAMYRLKWTSVRSGMIAGTPPTINFTVDGLVKETIFESDSTWDVTVTADTTNGRPAIMVTGVPVIAGTPPIVTTIHWVAKIEMTEVA